MRKWINLTSKEISDLIDCGYLTAILPFGSVEQHGKHLVTAYDYLIAERLSEDVAVALGKALVLPTLTLGQASHHKEFRGTITLRNTTIFAIFDDLIESLENNGIKRLIIINGHGGNYSILNSYFNDKKHRIEVWHDGLSKILFRPIDYFKEHSEKDMGLHAGHYETSLAMYTHPEAVRYNELNYDSIQFHENSNVDEILKRGLKTFYPSGVIGNPRHANETDGKRYYDYLLDYYKKEIGI